MEGHGRTGHALPLLALLGLVSSTSVDLEGNQMQPFSLLQAPDPAVTLCDLRGQRSFTS